MARTKKSKAIQDDDIMKYDSVISGGTVVTAEGQRKVDVAIKGERIVGVGKGLAKSATNGATIVNASGKYVIPGGIDVHTHLELPFCGTVSSDDWNTGTRAAARGGVTTLIDFAIPYGKDSLQDAFHKWMAKAKDKACIDYSFHMCITDWDKQGKELPKLIKMGCPSFKQFMIYESQGWQSDDRALFLALEAGKKHGAMIMVHAESSKVLDELIARHHKPQLMKKYGARLHTMTRPNVTEYEAIQRAVTWAEVTGGCLFVVHMSTKEGADIIKAARSRGVKAFAETCVQYLALDDSVFSKKDGHLYATCPQIKKKEDSARLWQGLRSGEVCNISTDTCSFDRKQKGMWKGDWTKIPMGMPGLETMLPVIYTRGVLQNKLTMRQFVAKCCTNPAKVMGLYPKKGTIAVGSDADVVVFDPQKKIKVDHAKMETNTDWSPFQGWLLAGFAQMTFSRGRQIVDNYKFIGENGWGQWQRRSNVGQL